MIGDSGVGKTAAVQRFCTGEFHPAFASTVGLDYAIKTLALPEPAAATPSPFPGQDTDEGDGAALVDSLRPAADAGRQAVDVSAATLEVTMQLWDTSGQERFMALTRQVRPHSLVGVSQSDAQLIDE